MAIRLSLFKTPKHRSFQYKPIYWDPEKEERDERLHPEKNQPVLRRGTFQKALYSSRRHPKGKSERLIRIIIFIALATLVLAAFYFTKVLNVVMHNIH